MDTELMMLHFVRSMKELADEHEGAASNERLWALGVDDIKTSNMHIENAAHNTGMAEFYRYLAGRALDLVETFVEEL